MSDIIELLPDSIANQIAAGEVIQRPASVVKELIENAVDAGATEITVNIKDAGKTLIQVIDNGKGMSETDARMAFERHATSKIRKAEDLFKIDTMGFRGEALASIAAIATAELKTCAANSDIGVHLIISGSEIEQQEVISCPKGSNFSIRNLFFNIPARRKFLKKEATEFAHIISEFQKTALTQPEISFTLLHNSTTIFKLPKSGLRQRITDIFGKKINKQLVSVNSETSILNIYGFIGRPEAAKKKRGEQYFFVNKRYMKHPYFHKAITLAYDQLLRPGYSPPYFLYFDISPSKIDINIHPQKTEIKFTGEPEIFQLLRASIKQTLGKFNIVDSIDFNQEGAIHIPYLHKNTPIVEPKIKVDTSYNPFEQEEKKQGIYGAANYGNFERFGKNKTTREKQNDKNWDKLYAGFDAETTATHSPPKQQEIEPKTNYYGKFFQLRNKYIITSVKSGLMLIDQKRAHERILFEQFLTATEDKNIPSQQTLYPVNIELSVADFALLENQLEELHKVGFDISVFGKQSVIVNGTPAFLDNPNAQELIIKLIQNLKNQTNSIDNSNEEMAMLMAKSAALGYGKKLEPQEITALTDRLFACQSPRFSPQGKKVITIIDFEDLEKLF